MKLPQRKLLLLLVVVALAVAGLILFRREPITAQGDSPPDLLALAPADASLLFYGDLAALRGSPFLRQLAALAPPALPDRDYAEFVQATGFDYTSDLNRVMFAARSGAANDRVMAVAEGRFERERIVQYALRSGRVERQSDADFYVVPGSQPGKQVVFTFLSNERILLTDRVEPLPGLAALNPSPFDPAMRERLERVAGAALLGVGRADALPQNFYAGGLRSDQFNNLIRSLRWFSLAARPEGERLEVALEGECDTPENARQLASTLDGLRLLGQAALADPQTRQRLQPQARAALENLLRVLQLSQDNQRVRVTLELTPQMIESIRPQ